MLVLVHVQVLVCVFIIPGCMSDRFPYSSGNYLFYLLTRGENSDYLTVEHLTKSPSLSHSATVSHRLEMISV